MVTVAKGAGEKHALPKRSLHSDLSKRPPASLRSRGGDRCKAVVYDPQSTPCLRDISVFVCPQSLYSITK